MKAVEIARMVEQMVVDCISVQTVSAKAGWFARRSLERQ